MTDMHPHWHATNEDDAVPVKAVSSGVGVRVPVAAASRMPAAIVGVVLFATIGITLGGGWEALKAQVDGGTGGSPTVAAASSSSLAPVEIRITNAGFSPNPVTVRPGQTVTWINEQSIPHILTSQTLRNASGVYLNTPAVFPGSQESFTIGPREAEREYTYGSTTDQSLSGKIIVSKSTQAAASSKKTTGNAFGGLNDVPLPTGQGGPPKSASSRSSSARSASSSPIAVLGGPGNSSLAPAPASTTPPPQTVTLDQYAPPETITNPPLAGNVLPPQSPEPLAQPDTGPGIWIVVFLSVAALGWMTRWQLRNMR